MALVYQRHTMEKRKRHLRETQTQPRTRAQVLRSISTDIAEEVSAAKTQEIQT